MPDNKMISVLMAVRNESNYIHKTLDYLLAQNYPKELLEIIVIDGNSSDNTIQIAETYREKFTHFKIIKNAKILSASGWNLGISVAKGNVISILSGHVSLPSNYYSNISKYLTPDIAGVGARAIPFGFNKRSNQISKAFQSQLGSGGATYIRGKKNRFAETISFGCYWKKDLQKIGGFDENIVRGQDWDLNMRLRREGRKLFFINDVTAKYFVRDKLSALWKRQFLAGFWKFYINRKSKHHFLLRHLIPAIFSLIFTILFVLCFINITFLFVFLAFLTVYLLVIACENIKSKIAIIDYPMMAVIYFILHYAYGLGLLLGVGKK